MRAEVDVEALELSPALMMATALAMALFLYLLVSAIRMGFFLPATITAENRGGVRRSHELTRGNFFRIVTVLIAVAVPVAGLYLVRNTLIDGETLSATQRMALQAIGAIISVLFSGLFYAAAAHAYQSVLGIEATLPRDVTRLPDV